MNKRISIFMIQVFAALLLVAGCSDLNDGKGNSKELNNQLSVCKLDSSSLDDIVKREITESLTCLEENLIFFSELVKNEFSDEEGNPVKNLSFEKLDQFIRENYPDQVENLKYVDVFFQAAHLLFGDSYGFISRTTELERNEREGDKYLCPIGADVNKLDNLCLMMRLLKVFNVNAARVYQEINNAPKKLSLSAYIDLRTNLQLAIGNVSSFITTYITEPRNKTKGTDAEASLDIIKLLDIFTSDSNKDEIEKVKKLLFLKRMLLGGESSILGFSDFSEFLKKARRLGALTFNLMKLSDIDFKSEYDRYDFFGNSISLVEKVLHFQLEDKATLITLDQYRIAVEIAQEEINKNVDNPIDFLKYKNLLNEAKILLSNKPATREEKLARRQNRLETVFKPSAFDVEDVYEVLNKLIKVAGIGRTFSLLYEQNRGVLNSPDPIPSGYQFLNPYSPDSPESEHFDRFVRIANKLRYFRTDHPIPFYGLDYQRSEKGMIEVGVFEYLLELGIRHYEEKYPCDTDEKIVLNDPISGEERKFVTIFRDRVDGSVDDSKHCKNFEGKKIPEDYAGTATIFQSEILMVEHKDFFVDNDVYFDGRELVSAQNLILISDVFQQSSNGDGLLVASEAVEFIQQILSGIKVRDDLLGEMEKRCADYQDSQGRPGIFDYDLKGRPRFSVPCFRKNFLDILEVEFPIDDEDSAISSYRIIDQLPRFKTYYEELRDRGTTGEQELSTYIKRVEDFTRTCSEEGIPFNSVDSVAMFSGIYSVESTLNRWDTGDKKGRPFPNNVMDTEEINVAYEKLFKMPVTRLARPDLESLGAGDKTYKAVFRYLINKEKMPDFKKNPLNVAYRLFIRRRLEWLVGKWKGKADRSTIAAILANIKELSKKTRLENPNYRDFKCSKLRKPILKEPPADTGKGRPLLSI